MAARPEYFAIADGLHFYDFEPPPNAVMVSNQVPFWRMICGECGRKGHSSRFCRADICTYCTFRGHRADDCALRIRQNQFLFDRGYVTEYIDRYDNGALEFNIPKNFTPVPPHQPGRRDYRQGLTTREASVTPNFCKICIKHPFTGHNISETQ